MEFKEWFESLTTIDSKLTRKEIMDACGWRNKHMWWSKLNGQSRVVFTEQKVINAIAKQDLTYPETRKKANSLQV